MEGDDDLAAGFAQPTLHRFTTFDLEPRRIGHDAVQQNVSAIVRPVFRHIAAAIRLSSASDRSGNAIARFLSARR